MVKIVVGAFVCLILHYECYYDNCVVIIAVYTSMNDSGDELLEVNSFLLCVRISLNPRVDGRHRRLL